MAANTNTSARLAVKWIRDKAKSKYKKGSICDICFSPENLEFHHYYSLEQLYEAYKKERGYSDDDILNFREDFISEHEREIYDEVATLCNKHHKLLHSIYGVAPLLTTALKQKGWVNKQREKYVAIQ